MLSTPMRAAHTNEIDTRTLRTWIKKHRLIADLDLDQIERALDDRDENLRPIRSVVRPPALSIRSPSRRVGAELFARTNATVHAFRTLVALQEYGETCIETLAHQLSIFNGTKFRDEEAVLVAGGEVDALAAGGLVFPVVGELWFYGGPKIPVRYVFRDEQETCCAA